MSRKRQFFSNLGFAGLLVAVSSGCGSESTNSHTAVQAANSGGSAALPSGSGGRSNAGSGGKAPDGSGGLSASTGARASGGWASTLSDPASGGYLAGGTSGPAGGSTGGNAPTGGMYSGGKTSGSGGHATTGGAGTGGAGIGGTGGIGTGGSHTGGATAVACTGLAPTSTTLTVDTTGVTFNVGTGKLRVQVCQADIIRVQFTAASSIPGKTSLSVNKVWSTPTFCVTEQSGSVIITTARVKVKVNASTGVVSYTDLDDKSVLTEDSKTLTATTISGSSTSKVQATFVSPADEALYGLGQHQDGVLNKKGKQVKFHNVNNNVASSPTGGGDISIPLLVSTKGYGIYWDNAADGNFYGDDSNGTKYRFSSNAGDMVDYYFMYGPTIDQIIGHYRTATGAAPMFPKWAYGLFQSKDKYTKQSELLTVKDGYRNNKIPVDCIVQDWEYWLPYGQGSHMMNPTNYPDPAKLITDLHAANVHAMISIWPRYDLKNNPPLVAGENDNYNALKAINALFLGGTPGYPPPYDVYNADARTLVYKQIYDGLLGKYGWDAIWADASEPEGVDLNTVTTAIGKGFSYINAYPLQHSRALYEGWRNIGPDKKRVYVLTRSGFAGQQRYAASCWSGDIGADQVTYVRQIPAGLGFAISGMPYWTTDIGGYFGHNTNWSTAQNNELFTRWFQFGAFCPLFRIHGGGAREMYGDQWNATTKANLLSIDNLHYRLMPYLYSLAWKVTNESYTIMRPLVFDFQDDSKVYDIKDQFMYGPAILVNPVTTAGATTRSIYLPTGNWYDFWTGAVSSGGKTVTIDAPLKLIPLFVRAGSIVPMGPMIQYATQSADPLEIRVYKGKDANFTLYEDEGDTYNYESGKYSTIPFTWNESANELTIGARSGSYTGMPTSRTFNVVFVGADRGVGTEVTSNADQSIKYDGSEVKVTGK